MSVLSTDSTWTLVNHLRRADELLNDPARASHLEDFRGQLVQAFGEEPTIQFLTHVPVHGPEDALELPLADYLGSVIGAQHAALYRVSPINGHWVCVAAWGPHLPRWTEERVLLRWLMAHGSLLRSRLSLDGLSISQAERLFQELDTLQAELVVPCILNEGAVSVLVAGPPLLGAYGLSECLRLSLYHVAILGCQRRQALDLPPKAETRRQQELDAFHALKDLWFALKPVQPVPLLLLDELPKVVERLTRYFGACGFTVSGATREDEALDLVQTVHPSCLIVDLSLRQRMPLRLLEELTKTSPQVIVLGTTTGHTDHREAVAREFGVTRIFRKPLRLTLLAPALFEAALERTTQGVETPSL